MIIQINKPRQDIPACGGYPGLVQLNGDPIHKALSQDPEALRTLTSIDRRNFNDHHPFPPFGCLAVAQTTIIG